MVTLDDVAARAGVSRNDRVERAPRQGGCAPPKQPARSIAAAEELGYHPNLAARQLSSGTAPTSSD